MRTVVAAVGAFDRDLVIGLQLIGAEEKIGSSRKENVPIFQEGAPQNIRCVRECGLLRPGVGIVFGIQDVSFVKGEGLILPLRVDVGAVGR